MARETQTKGGLHFLIQELVHSAPAICGFDLVIPQYGIKNNVVFCADSKNLWLHPVYVKYLSNFNMFLQITADSETIGTGAIDQKFDIQTIVNSRIMSSRSVVFFNVIFLDSSKQSFDRVGVTGALYDISKMFFDQKFTDVIIKCEQGNLRAHKLILAARSEVFERMFHGTSLESQTGVVKCAFDKGVMQALLEYIYTNIFVTPDAKQLFEAADYYCLQELKMFCKNILMRNISVENAMSTLLLAEKHNLEDLRQKTLKFIGDNGKAVTRGAEFLNMPSETVSVDQFKYIVQLVIQSVLNSTS